MANLHTLSKGHLTANGDFTYEYQRRATFKYTNAAPQWQTTNGGNFNTVEECVRTILTTKRRLLEVYSSTHGTMNVSFNVKFHQSPLLIGYFF